MGQQILDIKYPLDIITCARIDGDTGICIVDNTLNYIFKRSTYIKIDHVEAGSHNLLGCFATKTNDAFQNIILFLQLSLIRQFKGMRKFVNRYIVILFGKMFIQESRRMY